MTQNHSHSLPASAIINRSFLIGIGLNVVYVVVEIIYGLRNNSTALLSDAAHNIGDISGLLLAFVAFRLQKVKPSKVFSYGYKKGSIVASFLNSILLAFAIGAIAWEGFQKVLHPNPLSGSVIMWVAGIGVIINFISAIAFKKNQSKDINIKAAYWHLMADALVSFGVVISGLLIHYFHWYQLDGITAIVVAVVVLFSTWQLFKDSIIAIMDGVPSAINRDEILEHLREIQGVKEVHHLHIWGMSTSENALTAHIVVNDFEKLALTKAILKKDLKEHNITHSTLEFELFTEPCEEKKL